MIHQSVTVDPRNSPGEDRSSGIPGPDHITTTRILILVGGLVGHGQMLEMCRVELSRVR